MQAYGDLVRSVRSASGPRSSDREYDPLEQRWFRNRFDARIGEIAFLRAPADRARAPRAGQAE